ncbi:tripartite tricarboxylate transporter substrate binding protein [Roseomonas sp. NAR14]|uniref:Tripartite tricarboxylate transporter substrate binding protein n=1 Tax=Roseomonas acroporae TaxID=2937791 RepID=A0A9X1Y690_9PROT|nr:tripartite tricarboxylate transporter substrate binding protein [Roseomonas acroporae]MCK8784764.1 tripartite tricarboxylate transporter substrate binding protein [Roseomonas acroporae]
MSGSSGIGRRAALGLAGAALAAGGARAQGGGAAGFPNRPITMLVPFPAGGTTDAQMRVFSEQLGRVLGQPVVVENKPGAGSTLGAAQVARARPDGYTLTQLTAPCIRLQFLQTLPFDVQRDFTPILHLTGYMFGIAVAADSPWRSWADFVAAAKRRPGEMNMGNTGANGTPHLANVQIAERAGIDVTHVPFRGEAEGLPALLGGHIQAMSCGSGASGLAEEGKVRWLNVWTAQRVRRWPDVPTLVELGYEGLVITSPYGVVGPAGMDPAVVRRLQEAMTTAARSPAHLAILERYDMALDLRDGPAYREFIAQQARDEEALVRRLNLRAG